jgi:hypothetical protein
LLLLLLLLLLLRWCVCGCRKQDDSGVAAAGDVALAFQVG